MVSLPCCPSMRYGASDPQPGGLTTSFMPALIAAPERAMAPSAGWRLRVRTKRESEIVMLAGQPGTVTIATNMAGRGTDIKLGAGVTEARPVAWAKGRGLDPEALLPVDPIRAEKIKPDQDDEVLEVGGCTSWARSVTRAGASIASSGAGAAVRATRGRRSSS